MLAEEALLLSKVFTKKSLEGIEGSLAGKNCKVKSTSKENGITTIVFEWTADNGDIETDSVQIADGSNSIDDNTISESLLWSSSHVSKLLEDKLDNVKLTVETEDSIVLYVDNVNGSDSNDGKTASKPIKNIAFNNLHKRYGYPKSILFILISDYDVKNSPIAIKGEQWVGIRGLSETVPYKKIYSSTGSETLIKVERTQMSYSYLFLDGTNTTSSLLYNDCNCCYFNKVQGTSSNIDTEALIIGRRANIMMDNCTFTSNKASNSNTSFLSGYNTIITLNGCSVNTRILSSALCSFMYTVGGTITYNQETKDDDIIYDLSVVRQSSFPTSLPANGGNSETVNNHYVNSDVPSEAKFVTISGFKWLTYVSSVQVKGTVTLDIDIDCVSLTLVLNDESSYEKVNNIAFDYNKENKILTIIANGNDFVADDKVYVSYIGL